MKMSDNNMAFLCIFAWIFGSFVLIYFALMFLYGPLLKFLDGTKLEKILYWPISTLGDSDE